MIQKFKVIFFSEVNSKFGYPILMDLCDDDNFEVVAFVTTPEGRVCSYYDGEKEQVDLALYSRSRGIPVYKPEDIRDEKFILELSRYHADYNIVANYQKIFDEKLIHLPNYMTLNFHPSPLPRYAGLAPFFWMARRGEKKSGVSCIKMSPTIDGGDIVMQKDIKLTGNETSLEIREKLFQASFRLFKEVKRKITRGMLDYQSQDRDKRLYFGNPKVSDMTITHKSSVQDAFNIMKSCAPKAAFLQIQGQLLSVISVGWVPKSNFIKYRLSDGSLYFVPEVQRLKNDKTMC